MCYHCAHKPEVGVRWPCPCPCSLRLSQSMQGRRGNLEQGELHGRGGPVAFWSSLNSSACHGNHCKITVCSAELPALAFGILT